MFGWLRELLDIRLDYKSGKLSIEEKKLQITPADPDYVTCESCETLKQQLSIANDEKRRLLDRLLEKPEQTTRIDTTELKVINPKTKVDYWPERRRILEENDRSKAKQLAMHDKDTVTDRIETAELEREVLEAGKLSSETKGEKSNVS